MLRDFICILHWTQLIRVLSFREAAYQLAYVESFF